MRENRACVRLYSEGHVREHPRFDMLGVERRVSAATFCVCVCVRVSEREDREESVDRAAWQWPNA